MSMLQNEYQNRSLSQESVKEKEDSEFISDEDYLEILCETLHPFHDKDSSKIYGLFTT